ncbi:hypothetical protein [Oceanobacillus sp. J11TS1]|uniref:hypothetical protein n=1 Tax=Oceanobacillus sp. J11TS1 TaxID=2807191 RepID=UPI001B046BB1|nr:hypothetical protein [Oceanobacillus sp. J11TS1]GIO25102.1 hypothetical protein J11TS1_36830 [Oceanobacillus sp. J11TS1]
MNLQPTYQKIFGQKEFLRNTVGTEYKTGGATLDASAFTAVAENGYVKAGTAVYLGEDGLYLPWTDAGEGDAREGAGLTSHDVKLVPNSNPVVGVLVAGHPLEANCTGVTEGFKQEVKGYLRFDA